MPEPNALVRLFGHVLGGRKNSIGDVQSLLRLFVRPTRQANPIFSGRPPSRRKKQAGAFSGGGIVGKGIGEHSAARVALEETARSFFRRGAALVKASSSIFRRGVQLGRAPGSLFRRGASLRKAPGCSCRRKVSLGKTPGRILRREVPLGKAPSHIFRRRVSLREMAGSIS